MTVSNRTLAPEQNDIVIQTRGLTKIFQTAGGEVRALNGVDLSVARSQMLVLLGPSGCGKTTLLRCIGGLERPDQGEITLGGRLVTSVRARVDLPPEHRNLGMMFQSYGLWPHMTALQNVAYPLTNKPGLTTGQISDRASAMLETMGIAELSARYPGQLSGGQQQRVALARALIGSPTALLFDEPLSNVDAQVRKRLREEIRQMKERRGFAGVYVTHDQEEAMALADVLAVMQDGLVAQIGTPWDVYRRPRTLYVARFVGDVNTLEATVVGVEGKRLVVDTNIGRTVIDDVAPLPSIGTHGHVVVRPEDLTVALQSVPDAQLNLYEGIVTNSVLFGPRVELHVEVGGVELRAWTSSVTRNEFAHGSGVTVQLPSGSATWISK